MVCLGNICRSPLAEGILRHKIELAGLGWEVQSAGTGSWTRVYVYESGNNRLNTTEVGGQTYTYPHHPQHGFDGGRYHLVKKRQALEAPHLRISRDFLQRHRP